MWSLALLAVLLFILASLPWVLMEVRHRGWVDGFCACNRICCKWHHSDDCNCTDDYRLM